MHLVLRLQWRMLLSNERVQQTFLQRCWMRLQLQRAATRPGSYTASTHTGATHTSATDASATHAGATHASPNTNSDACSAAGPHRTVRRG